LDGASGHLIRRWTSDLADVAKFWDQTLGAVEAQAFGLALTWVNAYFRQFDNEKLNDIGNSILWQDQTIRRSI